MCGIAGVFNRNHEPASSQLIARMNEVLVHRGPDGDGVWCEGAIGLGHRRLAIIDLSPQGHQPMMTRDKRYVISYNGEVYNFRELRTELEALGYPFHSKTDTEVVLNAFAEWGIEAISRFNGMFAFAIWDTKSQQLTLVRDRYGIKPLYYFLTDERIIFASEVKAILMHPTVKRALEHSALIEYFTFQNILSDKTLFKDIKILPPASILSITNDKHSLRSYWDFDFSSQIHQHKSKAECIEQLDFLFCQAVNRQLVSDVELGAYLSGGMDSAAITARSSSQLPYIKTFTCGFDVSSVSGLEQTFDERKDAEHMSYLFKTEHYEMVLKAGDMERCLPSLAYHIEEPRVGQSYPNYYVARLASKFGKVVLAGTGGDEIFAGYPWRYYPHALHSSFDGFTQSYYRFWQRIFQQTEHAQIFAPIWSTVKDVSTYDIFRSIFKPPRQDDLLPADYVNQSLYFEAKTFLQGLLIIEDKLSMAHSLETRVPFLDNDLVDFALTIPIEYKLGCLAEVVQRGNRQKDISQYLQKSRDGKLILRDMMRKYVPIEIVEKIKQGFSAPDASWFQGESIDYVKSIMHDKHAHIYQYLDEHYVRTKIGEHFQGKVNHRLLIWSLLSFEHWCKQYLEGKSL